MSSQDVLVLILITLFLLLLPAYGLSKMFVKAGIPSWKAWVPFLNTWEMVKATGLRQHWFFWQFIPVAGWFITLWIYVEFVKLFGKFRLHEHALTVLVPFLYFIYLGTSKDERFLGREVVKKHKKTTTREWIDAAVFAIVAATLIRIFVFEAYTIPTGSMEKTLLVNDFLFVSKLSYGPRIPNTPLAVPFVHHTIPGLKVKSYTEAVKLPYRRWFASPVKRNDVVVFNFPAGDTLTQEYDSANPYYDILRSEENRMYQQLQSQTNDPVKLAALSRERAREVVWDNYTVTTRPVDKRENYIKRCVGIPGDTLEIRDGILYVQGQRAFISPTAATDYAVYTKNKILTEEELREAGVKLNSDESSPDFEYRGGNNYSLNLSESEAAIVAKIPGVDSVVRQVIEGGGLVFPFNVKFPWTIDNFGPLWVPKKGVTIPLTEANIILYERLIRVYENNKWEVRDGKIYINDQLATSYTFKMDYYWMMGDNRHRSQDSRYWGFVPEDHVVGEAWLIWMSWNGGMRWERLFRTIH